jgi:tetratricopeptide (TPR) repeat protein
MLREDTAANQFKAWVINRTDSTVILDAINGIAEDWLEVKDDNSWRVYNSDNRQIDCATGLTYRIPLRRNDFAKVSTEKTPGAFQTLARARFTLDGVAHYSSIISVAIDTIGFLPFYLRRFTQALQHTHKDSSERRSRFQYFLGVQLVRKKRYDEAREKYTEALALDPTNYRIIIAQGDLNLKLATRSNPDKKQLTERVKAVFASFEVIPSTEEELQEKIELRRKIYARWLED